MFFRHMKTAASIVILSALFAGCSGGDPTDNIVLPQDGTPKRKAMNETCLKALPAADAKSLQDALNSNYPSDFSKRDEMLRLCMKNLSEGKVSVPH